MNEAELQTIIASGESYTIECKEAVNTDHAKELVAFANASGGRVLPGVSDKGAITGIADNNGFRSKIQSRADGCDPHVPIELKRYQNITIVPVSEGAEKPCRCTKGFYLRSGSNSQKMTTGRIREFLQSEGKVRYDGLPKPNIAFPDLLSAERLDRFMTLSGIPRILPDDELLANLGAVTIENGKSVCTNAGLLFFNNAPEVLIPQSIVTCVLYKGTKKVTVLDRKDLKTTRHIHIHSKARLSTPQTT